MSIFDVLNTDSLGSVLETLTGQARSAARNMERTTPGGLGGLLGAGALGAVLGNFASGDLLKNVALAGAGAVAWNFYRKWAAGQQEQAPAEERRPAGALPSGDPTAELVMRSMIYAARADGAIDASERQRIDKILETMLGGQDAGAVLARLQTETIDPAKIAAQTRTPEQAEDVYRLSCSVIDVDHFMERGYLDALAQSLGIGNARKGELEAEASQARAALRQAVQQSC
ncbi:DUF533 domain-containing protein [Desulfovibrio sp.]|uniref:tellurite resistance TerB family protein n=1 Tax=Desulfovibrio sp. TaxID=885 RepID=UPI0023C7FC22|nr:DUF533 domain-containing protein [Desulfovibrio sp.]MDE7242211.1 tellurite resistance TerB family protein [Desulfovibrio sp.]